MKKCKGFLSYVLLGMMLITSVICNAQTVEAANSKLEVHFIDVGQGDATLVIQGTHAMLIDAGDNSSGTEVQYYLKNQGVKKLDYLILTHTDSDHAGGADVIITKFDIDTVIYPDVSSDTATWRDVVDAMKYKYYKRTNPVVGDTYNLGTAKFTILGPSTVKGVSDNNTSTCIRLVHNKKSFLFVGDSESDEQSSIIKSKQTIKSDVYKVSHHGSTNGTTQDFLNEVNPKFAVISCGEDNSYGHPTETIMTMLRNAKVKVYRTDEQGDIVATSNGKKITWNIKPSTTWASGNKESNNNTNIGNTDKNSNSGNSTGNSTNYESNDNIKDNVDKNNTTEVELYVWLSATGTKYHSKNNCGNMNPSKAYELTEKDAISRGFDKCSKCWY